MAGPSSQPLVPDRQRADYEPLVRGLAAVCGGIACDRLGGVSLVAWWFGSLAALIGWWLLWGRGREGLAAVPLLVALVAVGGAWHHCCWRIFATDELGRFARPLSQPVCLEARVAAGPRRVPAPPYDPLRPIQIGERTRVELDALAIRDADRWRPAAGSATLLVDGYPLDVAAGDRVRVVGQLSAARPPANPGEFDYAANARAQRRLCLLRAGTPDCVTRVAPGGGWSIGHAIDALRSTGHELLVQHLSAERSGLASAMFLGLRDELDEDTSQAFLETGTIHLLVISGLNVGILAACLLAALRLGLLPPRPAVLAVAALTALYAVVTDSQPPVVRATVMVIVLCSARAIGRLTVGLNTLAAAALAVLAINPCELFSAGTQLSFLAAATIICMRRSTGVERGKDPLDRLIAQSRPWLLRASRGTLVATWKLTLLSTVIWLVVLPLVMARFHLVSPAAVLLGPILALPVTVAMAAGFGVLLVGGFVPPLAALFGAACDGSLLVVQQAVEVARGVPGSHFWVSGPDAWWLVVAYAGLVGWAVAPRLRPPRRWCFGLVAGWTAVGFVASLLTATPGGRLECTVLSVGHGCAVVVRTPEGKTILYDAGQLGSPVFASRTIAGFLWSRGITRLDAVVLSHADLDHYNALPRLLRQFPVGTVYVSPGMFDRPNAALTALRSAIDRSGTPTQLIWSGDRLRGGGCRIDVLHPPQTGVLGSDNANSIVLVIEHQGRRILLTGDLESPGLDDLLAERPIHCDLLLAPHHGSRHSDPPGMAAWSRPQWVVISGSGRDDSTAVEAAYTSRGSRVLSTARFGAVQARIDRGELRVEPFRPL